MASLSIVFYEVGVSYKKTVTVLITRKYLLKKLKEIKNASLGYKLQTPL